MLASSALKSKLISAIKGKTYPVNKTNIIKTCVEYVMSNGACNGLYNGLTTTTPVPIPVVGVTDNFKLLITPSIIPIFTLTKHKSGSAMLKDLMDQIRNNASLIPMSSKSLITLASPVKLNLMIPYLIPKFGENFEDNIGLIADLVVNTIKASFPAIPSVSTTLTPPSAGSTAFLNIV